MSSIIPPVFSVTWSSEIIIICCSRNISDYYYQCWKKLNCLKQHKNDKTVTFRWWTVPLIRAGRRETLLGLSLCPWRSIIRSPHVNTHTHRRTRTHRHRHTRKHTHTHNTHTHTHTHTHTETQTHTQTHTYTHTQRHTHVHTHTHTHTRTHTHTPHSNVICSKYVWLWAKQIRADYLFLPRDHRDVWLVSQTSVSAGIFGSFQWACNQSTGQYYGHHHTPFASIIQLHRRCFTSAFTSLLPLWSLPVKVGMASRWLNKSSRGTLITRIQRCSSFIHLQQQ